MGADDFSKGFNSGPESTEQRAVGQDTEVDMDDQDTAEQGGPGEGRGEELPEDESNDDGAAADEGADTPGVAQGGEEPSGDGEQAVDYQALYEAEKVRARELDQRLRSWEGRERAKAREEAKPAADAELQAIGEELEEFGKLYPELLPVAKADTPTGKRMRKLLAGAHDPDIVAAIGELSVGEVSARRAQAEEVAQRERRKAVEHYDAVWKGTPEIQGLFEVGEHEGRVTFVPLGGKEAEAGAYWKALEDWVDDQPRAIRKLYTEGDTEEVLKLMGMYREVLAAKAKPKDKVDRQALAGASGVKSGRNPTGPAMGKAGRTFSDGFNS